MQQFKKYLPILLFLPCLYVFLCLSLSRSRYEEVNLGLRYGVYDGELSTELMMAKDLLPLRIAPFLCQADLQRIYTGLGKNWYEVGKKIKLNKLDRYAEMKQSYENYTKAIAINPHDILAVRGIAETVAELEFIYPALFPANENPYDALPFFQRMSEVEPNGFASNYSYAAYLHKKGLKKELLQQVKHTAKIYPSYSKLRNASFYSTETRDEMKSGLYEAIDSNIMTYSAHYSLSYFYEKEKNYKKAAIHYQKGMEARKDKQTSKTYLKLGSLFLKADDIKNAYPAFITYLGMNLNDDKAVKTIYASFVKEEKINEFFQFAALAETVKTVKQSTLQLYVARAQMRQRQFTAAKQTLQSVNTKQPNPVAYYLLAEIARKEKDWDAMELSIQKATVLDPRNGKYFNILADALIYQKKYRPAAEYMQKALVNDPENAKYSKKLNKIRSYFN